MIALISLLVLVCIAAVGLLVATCIDRINLSPTVQNLLCQIILACVGVFAYVVFNAL